MNTQQLMEQFNHPARIGTLSTSNRDGELNAALFSSLRMIDAETVVMACGENRTLANLQQHPQAVCLFFRPGKSPFEWRGGRLYLEVSSIEREGEQLARLVEQVRENAGEMAARSVKAAIRFRITALRPLIDLASS